MRIPVKDVPQADSLDDVLKVVRAVARAARTYQELAEAIGKTARQGRYYRRAAEIMGLIKSAGSNLSILTPAGRKYLESEQESQKELLAGSMLDAPLFQRVVPFLESRLPTGCSRKELETFIENVSESSGPSMIPRRASTVISWMQSIGMLNSINDKIFLRPLPYGLKKIEYKDIDEPILPQKFELEEYKAAESKAKHAPAIIRYFIDESKKERAASSHRMLTDLVAQKVRAAGGIPRSNIYIDLAARISSVPFIFEMKSATPGNTHQQIRLGLSQLYEYRYMQNVPDARLVLVIERGLGQKHEWLNDYLMKDRGIHLVWDGGRALHCHSRSKPVVGFLL